MSGITKDEMEELFKKFLGGTKGTLADVDLENLDEFIKSIEKSTDTLKKQLPAQKQFGELLKGQKQSYIDLTDEVDKLDEELRKLRQSASTASDQEKIHRMQEARDTKLQVAASENARRATKNFGIGVADVAQTLLKGAFDYAKNLQSGASGVEAGTAAAATAARATGELISGTGSAMSGLGPVLGMLKGKLGIFGRALSLIGPILEVFGKKAADFSESAIKFLGDELKKTQRAFKEINQAGALLGSGMTEMRQIAADAGLDVARLAEVVKSSREELLGMGVGLGEATKRIAGISKELRSGELGIQLRKLGFSAEEQASLAASVSARLRASGDERVYSDQEVAKMTVQYGKDLKVLADITGQDAKKAMEKAKLQAMEQDLLSEALAKGGPEAVKKLQAQLATMPEAMKKGYMEFVSSGGTAIADAATNVAITQNPKILDQYQELYRMLGDSNVNAATALRRTGELNEQTYEYAMKHAGETREIAQAARFGNSEIARGATKIYNDLIKGYTTQAKGATKAADKAADAAAENFKPLDKAIADLEERTLKLQSALGEELLGPITTFAETLAAGTETVSEALEKMGLGQKGMGEKVGNVAGGLAGGALGATAATVALGALLTATGVGAAVGIPLMLGAGLVGGGLGGWAGEEAGGAIGKSFDTPPKRMAIGGVVERPTRAILGEAGMTEAVVPLPNGRSIPLDLDLGQISSTLLDEFKNFSLTMGQPKREMTSQFFDVEGIMTKQLTLLEDIKDVLDNSRDLQQQYVNNTY